MIQRVVLVDFFEKEEWLDKRSITFRFVLVDHSKTLVKEEIEAVRQKAIAALGDLRAELRS